MKELVLSRFWPLSLCSASSSCLKEQLMVSLCHLSQLLYPLWQGKNPWLLKLLKLTDLNFGSQVCADIYKLSSSWELVPLNHCITHGTRSIICTTFCQITLVLFHTMLQYIIHRSEIPLIWKFSFLVRLMMYATKSTDKIQFKTP